jgi:hypothetical protein
MKVQPIDLLAILWQQIRNVGAMPPTFNDDRRIWMMLDTGRTRVPFPMKEVEAYAHGIHPGLSITQSFQMVMLSVHIDHWRPHHNRQYAHVTPL